MAGDEVQLGVAVVPVRVTLDEMDAGLSEARARIEAAFADVQVALPDLGGEAVADVAGQLGDLGEAAEGAQEDAEALGAGIAEGMGSGSVAAAGLTGQVEDLGLGLQTVNGEAQVVTQGIADGFDDGASSIEAAVGQLKTLGTVALSAWGTIKGLEKVLQFGEEGAEIINIGAGFADAAAEAGYAKAEMLDVIEAVGRGVLDDEFLMQEFTLTTRAAGAAIADEWPQLISGAMAIRAQGYGEVESNLQSLDQYVRTGFGRALKQMGLQIPDNGPLMEAYAASVGKTTAELTEAEQAQARMNALLEALQPLLEETNNGATMAGAGIAQLKTAGDNFFDAAKAGWAGTIDDLAGSLAGLINRVAEADSAWRAAAEGWVESEPTGSGRNVGGENADAAVNVNTLTQALQDAIEVHWRNVTALEAGMAAAASWTDAEWKAWEAEKALAAMVVTATDQVTAKAAADAVAGNATGIVGQQAMSAAGGLGEFGDAATTAGSKAAAAADGVYYLAGSIAEVSAQAAEMIVPDLSGFEGQMDTLRSQSAGRALFAELPLNEQMALRQAGVAAEELGQTQEEVIDGYIAGRTAARQFGEESVASIGAAGSAFESLQQDMEDYYSSWQDQVAGVLTPTQTLPDFDAAEEELGGYVDKWDEFGKRVEDVRQLGFASPWVGELGKAGVDTSGMSEEQLKLAATQTEEEFYNLQFPELINWDAVATSMTEKAQTAVNLDNLLAVAPTYLQPYGLGLDSALLQQAMGLGGMTVDLSGLSGLATAGGETTEEQAAQGLTASMAGSGTDGAEAFAEAWGATDWHALGTATGQSILEGVKAKLDARDTAFAESLEGYIAWLVQYFLTNGVMP